MEGMLLVERLKRLKKLGGAEGGIKLMRILKSNLPDKVKALPVHAQEVWTSTYDSVYEQCSESKVDADKIAWAVTKQQYREADGKWIKRITESMHGVSLFELMDKARAAVKKEFKKDEYSGYYDSRWFYVKDMSETEVVVSDGDDAKTISIEYSMSGDGSVVLNMETIKPVIRTYVNVELKESVNNCLRAAKGKEGKQWEIILLSAGRSANDVIYTESLIREAVNLFNGVPALLRSDEDHIRDGDRSVRNIVGDISNAHYVNGVGAVGTLNIHDDAEWLSKKMLPLWEAGKLQGDKPLFAYSFVGGGRGNYDDDGYFVPDVISEVSSVDVVVKPATSTSTRKLVAGLGRMDMKNPLVGYIKKHAPDLHKQINLEDPDAEQVNGFFAEAQQRAENKHMNNQVTSQNTSSEGGGASASADDINVALAESLQEIRVFRCEQTMEKKLSEAKTLPKPFAEAIRKRFAGKVFKEPELVEAIKEQVDAIAAIHPSGDIQGFGFTSSIQVGMGETTKLVAALDGFFMEKDVDGVPWAKSFREIYSLITGDVNITGHLSEAKNLKRFSEAMTTSSWAEILGDSITRGMLQEYNLPTLNDWRKLVTVTAPKDYRTQRRMRIGGYSELPAVAQSGPYTALTSPTDEEATYAVSKRGGTEKITIEMIANDDQGAIRRIPIKLSRAATNTLYRFIFDFHKDNGNIHDGIALYHASHSNLGSSALDATSLLAAKKAMMQQTAYNNSTEYLGTIPRYLIIPVDLEDTAFKLAKSSTLIGPSATEGSQNATEPNIHSTYGLEVIIVPYWTDATDWLIHADPKDIPTIEIGFLGGNEEPELFVQDNPNQGSLFSNDEITYKIRHIYGGAVMDHRGMYKAVVV